MKLGYKNTMTSHGFRSMFSTTANRYKTKYGFDPDVIEASLAHAESNKVRAAQGPFIILCQLGKIKNTKGHKYENRDRCRAIC